MVYEMTPARIYLGQRRFVVLNIKLLHAHLTWIRVNAPGAMTLDQVIGLVLKFGIEVLLLTQIWRTGSKNGRALGWIAGWCRAFRIKTLLLLGCIRLNRS